MYMTFRFCVNFINVQAYGGVHVPRIISSSPYHSLHEKLRFACVMKTVTRKHNGITLPTLFMLYGFVSQPVFTFLLQEDRKQIIFEAVSISLTTVPTILSME
jgi:hypothetical protein